MKYKFKSVLVDHNTCTYTWGGKIQKMKRRRSNIGSKYEVKESNINFKWSVMGYNNKQRE